MSSGATPELWPLWLLNDIPRLGIWAFEHDSAPTSWHGQAMSRVDRANNALPLLLSEEAIKYGQVSFVVHSFGGLILEQMLRNASDRAHADPLLADFISRIDGITFLGTPHAGATLATLGGKVRFLTRLSLAALGLERNDPDLRDLNHWYRTFSSKIGIDTQSLVETRPMRWLGLIVKPDSSDIGLPSPPIPIDADHFELASPGSQDSEIYRHIKEQIRRLIVRSASGQPCPVDLDQGTQAVDSLLEKIRTADSSAPITGGNSVIDSAISEAILQLRRARFFQGAHPVDEALRLSNELLMGEFARGSSTERAKGLAWCARLVFEKHRDEGVRLTTAARRLALVEEVQIAEAFGAHYAGKSSEALAQLAALDSSDARAAALIIVTNSPDSRDVFAWLKRVGIATSDLSPDGKVFLIKQQIEAELWDEALAVVESLVQQDFELAPVLYYLAAAVQLVHTISAELRSTVIWQLPFDAASIPLAGDSAAISRRVAAKDLYEKAAAAARTLGCQRASFEASDRALWLGLRDPTSRATSLASLAGSMRDPRHSLRRLPLALQFGLQLDLKAVEAEVDRQDATFDGNSPDAALARFSLAITKNEPAEIATYIAKYKDSLLKHLNPEYVTSVQIQMLVHAGELTRAEQVLQDSPPDIRDDQRLRRIISDASEANPLEARERRFEKSDLLIDLANLVELAESKRDWERLAKFGYLFFARTKDIRALSSYAHGLYELGEYGSVVASLRKNADILSQSLRLQELLAHALYYSGDIKGCQVEVAALRLKRDDPADRQLLVQASIASGDWEQLSGFVEHEWQHQSERSAEELLRAAQIALQIRSPRVKDLISKAVIKANDDPGILVSCYSAATSAGWEDETTTAWLHTAAEHSGPDGPVQRVSMQDLVSMNPDWQQREKNTWEQLSAGRLPIFAAASLLNRTLIELFLLPALRNPDVQDVRRRSIVYAFSGARRSFLGRASSAAFDPTSLLILSVLGAMSIPFKLFERVIIPHSTMSWLFEEQRRIQFHQPSKFADSKEIRRLVDAGSLVEAKGASSVDPDLAAEVGDDLALLFAEAEGDLADNANRQRLVVRSAPIHRAGSLMEEQADIGRHAARVCGCLEVVEALTKFGQLTAQEKDHAVSYLRLHEQPWSHVIEIERDAVLYLDPLSVTYLQHLKLLPKLRAAGLTAAIPRSEINESDNLTDHEDLTAKATNILDGLRKVLAAGIADGTVLVAPFTRDNSKDLAGPLQRHPTFELMRASQLADVTVIDDRHFNQHGFIDTQSGRKPIWTTFDLIRFHVSDGVQLTERATQLRRAGFAFVSVTASELRELVEAASVVDNALVETAELKALREILLLYRMSGGLQLPGEDVWLDSMMHAFVEAIRSQWTPMANIAYVRARCDWLLAQFDIRNWSESLARVDGPDSIRARYRAQILSLSLFVSAQTDATRSDYWAWYEEAVLNNVRTNEPQIYADVIGEVRRLVDQARPPKTEK